MNVELTLNAALTFVVRDVLDAGPHHFSVFRSTVDPKLAQVTVFRPPSGVGIRSAEDAWGIAVTAGAKGQDIEDKGDHLKVPVLVADDVQVHTVHLVVQYGAHADLLPDPDAEETPDPVTLIPRQRMSEPPQRTGDIQVMREDGTLGAAQ